MTNRRMPNHDAELTWEDVQQFHRDRRGVFQDIGGVASIIYSESGLHKNVLAGEAIHYVLPERPSYRRDKAAMLRAYEKTRPFIVFRKLAVNRYRNIGKHVIQSYHSTASETVFVIVPEGIK